jgi:hypothetical protein
MGHGLCESGGSIYRPKIFFSADCTHNDKSRNKITSWFEIVKATNKAAISIQDLFHYIWLARYPNLNLLSLTMGVLSNSNLSSNKFVSKTNMALKPNQL